MDPIDLDLPDVDRDFECHLCGEPTLQGMKNTHITISQYYPIGTIPAYRKERTLLSVLAGPKCTEELEDFADQISPIQYENWEKRVRRAEKCSLCRGEIKDDIRYAGRLLSTEDRQSQWIAVSYCENCVEVTGEFVQNLASTANE